VIQVTTATITEENEAFFANLINPAVGTQVGRGQGRGIIVDHSTIQDDLIPVGGVGQSTVAVSGVPAGQVVRDVTVTVSISHPHPELLRLQLVSPNRLTVERSGLNPG